MIRTLAQRWWPPACVALIAAGLYARTFWADFLRWDDHVNVQFNPLVEQGSYALIWTQPYFKMFIPATYTVWSWVWQLSPQQPWGFHLVNVLLHATNTVLVYLVARRLLRPDEVRGALLAALLFACHPLQVETVAWISCGRDLLAAMFSLWATCIVLSPDSRRWAGWITAAFATGVYVLSCLSKPSVAIVPVAVAFVAYGCGRLTRRRARILAVWLVPAITVTLVTKNIQQLDADLRVAPMNLGHRLLVAIDTLSFYVQKLFVPWPLAADYGRTPQVALDGGLWPLGLGALLVLGILLAVFRKRIPQRTLYFAGLYVVFLLPVLGIIPFQAQGLSTVADRYNYMALIGAGLLLGSLVGRRLWPAVAVGVLAIGGCAALTYERTLVWANNEAFFQDMLDRNPRSAVALGSLGQEYMVTGRLAKAAPLLSAAVALKPMESMQQARLAQLYMMQGRPDRVLAEIVPLLNDREFLRLNQTEAFGLAGAYQNAARAHWTLQHWPEAGDYYCRWFFVYGASRAQDWERKELQDFLADAGRHALAAMPCAVK